MIREKLSGVAEGEGKDQTSGNAPDITACHVPIDLGESQTLGREEGGKGKGCYFGRKKTGKSKDPLGLETRFSG